MSAAKKIIQTNALETTSALFAFAQTTLTARFIGLELLGQALVIGSLAAFCSLLLEFIASERLAKESQTNPLLRRSASKLLSLVWLVTLTAAMAASYLVTDSYIAYILVACLPLPGQYLINIDSTALGRPYLPAVATTVTSVGRLVSVFVLIYLGIKEFKPFFFAYFIPPITVYSGFLFFSYFHNPGRENTNRIATNISQLLKECRSTTDYILYISSKRFREFSLALLEIMSVVTPATVAFLIICTKGTDFILSQIRTIEIALRNEKLFRANRLAQENLILIGCFSCFFSMIISTAYIYAAGLNPRDTLEAYLYSAITIPVALNSIDRAAIFHLQAYRHQALTYLGAAAAVQLTTISFSLLRQNGSMGFIIGSILGAILINNANKEFIKHLKSCR